MSYSMLSASTLTMLEEPCPECGGKLKPRVLGHIIKLPAFQDSYTFNAEDFIDEEHERLFKTASVPDKLIICSKCSYARSV